MYALDVQSWTEGVYVKECHIKEKMVCQ